MDEQQNMQVNGQRTSPPVTAQQADPEKNDNACFQCKDKSRLDRLRQIEKLRKERAKAVKRRYKIMQQIKHQEQRLEGESANIQQLDSKLAELAACPGNNAELHADAACLEGKSRLERLSQTKRHEKERTKAVDRRRGIRKQIKRLKQRLEDELANIRQLDNKLAELGAGPEENVHLQADAAYIQGKSRLNCLHQIERHKKERAKAAKRRDRIRQKIKQLQQRLEDELANIQQLDSKLAELS